MPWIKNIAVIFFIFLLLPVPLPAQEKKITTQEDQVALELTVYNSHLGLVKDQRQVRLDKGVQELKFMDVAAQIIPSSVTIRSLQDTGAFSVLEQNYEYDLLNPRKLLDKYVGKEVKLFTKNYYTEREEMVSAVLLANNDNQPVFQIGKDITFNHPGRILFPEIPPDLISKPTLVWLLNNGMTQSQKIEALYLTKGINWKSDYILVLNAQDTMADLSGWVTIDNKSGAAYRNAGLKLVAGDIHQVQEDLVKTRKAMVMAKEAAAPPFKEDSFFEYHIYTLERKTTLKENQTKQISLLNVDRVPVTKEFTYYGSQYYYRNRQGEVLSNQKVGVHIQLINAKENRLGMPLPKGTVRAYKRDAEGSLQFIGEDTIDHTPKDEKVRLKLGEAFDLKAERKQTHWEKLASDTYESAYEISIRNHKKEDVVVRIIEPLPGDWKVLEQSLPYKKQDAATIAFDLPVPKDKESKLRYRVRIRF
ncbi:MAG: DUF4139 domain-containing protein [Thermodesulfobacteriota bacterium]